MGNILIKRHMVALLALVFILGCGTSSSIVNKIRPERPILKKKVMVLPAVNRSNLSPEKADQITSGLIEILKESPFLIIERAPEDFVPATEGQTTRYGVSYYQQDFLSKAKDLNLNAMLAVYLPPVEITHSKAGIWPFRHAVDEYKVSMIVNVMDATNGCLFLTEMDSEKAAFETDDGSKGVEKELLEQALKKAIPEILSRQAEKVQDVLEKGTWTGRIIGEQKGLLMINAGKDVGILPDQEFAVYRQGESIVCKTGGSVDLLGEKTGTVKAVSVLDEYTLAAPVTGGPFASGQTVIFIRN